MLKELGEKNATVIKDSANFELLKFEKTGITILKSNIEFKDLTRVTLIAIGTKTTLISPVKFKEFGV
ncbi:hypothetical protein KUL17_05660 [Alteromonas sp. KUL17]|nr:hypothetical protein KUL17_05660 [Alteromonas sp. KUL17]